jgi:glycine cleavage system H lipoate-binding protein
MLVGTDAAASDERCSSPQFRDCAIARQRAAEHTHGERCPLLHDTLVRYCEATPAARFIPFSDLAGRCGTDGYRYCETWLRMSRGGAEAARAGGLTDNLPVPTGLHYTANHMWLDLTPSGACCVGIDALCAEVLGRVQRISFVTLEGVHRPSAVVTARGIDWPLVFPRELLITGANVYMRHAPERLTDDPYGVGWLFEGSEAPGAPPLLDGLIPGHAAGPWMQHETERIAEFVHTSCGTLQNDGGSLAPDFAEHLSREDLLRLLNEFFAPHLPAIRTMI